MPKLSELAKQYAELLETARAQDKLAKLAGMLDEEQRIARGSNVVEALKELHESLEDLVYTKDQKPLSEADKDRIAREVGELLGLRRPERLRKATKEASIDNAIVVVQDIEDIINSTRKP